MHNWFSRVRKAVAGSNPDGFHLGSSVLPVMEKNLARIYLSDHKKFSNIFEPSIQWTEHGCSTYRFSYSFPLFRERRETVHDHLAMLVSPLGNKYKNWIDQIAREAWLYGAGQLLFGAEVIGPENFRFKLYLQFPPRNIGQKAKLLCRLGVPVSGENERLSLARLHLIGIDFGQGGISRIKTYYLYHRVNLMHQPGAFFPLPFFDYLKSLGYTQLTDVISIKRIEGKGAMEKTRASEIDLSLEKNGIAWKSVKHFIQSRGYEFDLNIYEELRSNVQTRENRLSFSMHDTGKLTLYYLVGS